MATLFDRSRFTLRDATAEDAAGIAAVHHAAIHDIGSDFYSPEIIEMWGHPRDPSKYTQDMAAGDRYFVIEPVQKQVIDAPHHGKVPYLLGFSSYAQDQDGYHLRTLYMRREAKGQGIARALYQVVEDSADANGAPELQIDGSLAGLGFYKAMGYQVLGEYKHQFKNHPGQSMEALKLIKRLKTA